MRHGVGSDLIFPLSNALAPLRCQVPDQVRFAHLIANLNMQGAVRIIECLSSNENSRRTSPCRWIHSRASAPRPSSASPLTWTSTRRKPRTTRFRAHRNRLTGCLVSKNTLDRIGSSVLGFFSGYLAPHLPTSGDRMALLCVAGLWTPEYHMGRFLRRNEANDFVSQRT